MFGKKKNPFWLWRKPKSRNSYTKHKRFLRYREDNDNQKKTSKKKSSKSAKRKWNRTHEFKRQKSTRRKVGHPVYVYGRSGDIEKYLVFTHSPETGKEDEYVELLHNIDPNKTEPSFLKKRFAVSKKDSLIPPDVEYAIHPDDWKTVKLYKK